MTGALAIAERLEACAVKRITDDGSVRLAWRSWGKGPPLVLLHGGFGSWLHWVRNIDGLAETFSVHAVDLPGLGDSGPPPEGYTGEILAAALARNIDRLLGVGASFYLGAFSLGAVIAAPLLREMGARTSGAVLIGAGGLGRMWKNAVADQRRRSSSMSEAEIRDVIRENLGRSMIGDPARIDEDTVSIQLRLLNQERRLFGLPLSQSPILLDCLPEIRSRTVLTWGEHDPYLSPSLADVAQILRESHPGLDLRIVPDAGHWANYELPETFRRIFYHLQNDTI